MGLPLVLLSAGLNSALNYQGQQAAQRDSARRNNLIQQAYLDAKLSSTDINKRVDIVGDSFDSAMQDTANAMAASSRSILNPNTVRAIATSKIMGQKIAAMTETQGKLEDYNRDITLKAGMAAAENAPSETDYGQIGTSLIQGAISGAMIDQAMKDDPNPKDGSGTSETSVGSNVKVPQKTDASKSDVDLSSLNSPFEMIDFAKSHPGANVVQDGQFGSYNSDGTWERKYGTVEAIKSALINEWTSSVLEELGIMSPFR